MKVDIKTLEAFKDEIEKLQNIHTDEDKCEAGIILACKYYTYLKDNGELYGAAALQVVTNTGLFGQVANIHLRTQAVFDGKSKETLEELQTRIVMSLVYADIIQRIKHDGELTYGVISKYHKLTFETYGLTHYAWGGLVVEELLGLGKWMMLHDTDQRGFESILTQLLQNTSSKATEYSVGRMISSIQHSLKCIATGEQDYLPTVTAGSAIQVATRYGVDINRVVQCDDDTLAGDTPMVKSYVYSILPANHASIAEVASRLEDDEIEDNSTTHAITLTPLVLLLYSHEIEQAKELILSQTININEVCSNKATALHVAAEEDLDEIALLLLQAGALINVTDDWGFTPLHHTAFNCAVNTAKILLTAGADTTIGDQIGNRTALHYAAGSGSLNIAALFVQNGFIIDSRNNEGETPLDVAKKMGHADMVNFLAGEAHYFD